jgi:tetratricopeptide (TPR) repeat protein
MTDHSSASIRPPKDWQDFERNSRILFECILNDIHVQNNGRTGQPQHGVDIFGRKDGKGSEWFGIQCKGKDANYGSEVTEKELRAEVEKSRKFTPSISDFILVTTAPADAAIQAVARKIIEERDKEGNPLNVSVWGWGELEARISQYPKALQAFEPDSSPYSNQILSDTGYIRQKTDGQSEILDEILQLVQPSNRPIQTTDDASSETETVDIVLHKQIDGYRDLLKDGKPRTGLRLLEKLKEDVWDTTSDRIKFRLITNIGRAKLDLSAKQEAIELFLEAIDYQPDDKIALANVALAYLLKNEPAKAITAAKEALQKDETNAEAASYLIQAHINDEDIDAPLELIPDAVKEAASVDIALVNFYRIRNDKNWANIAKKALTRNPDNEQITRFSAEAELEIALTTKGLLSGQKPEEAIDFDSLRKSAEALQSLWNKQYNSEIPDTDSSLPYNLTQLYRTIDEVDLAKIVVTQAGEKMPDAPDIIRLRVNFYLENNDTENAVTLLQKLSDDPESLLMLAEIQVNKAPEDALRTLEGFEKMRGVDTRHRILASGIRIDSWLTHPRLTTDNRIKNATNEYEVLNSRYPDNSLIALMCSRIQEVAGGDLAMNESLQKAKTLLTNSSNFYERYLVARRFESLDRPSDVADILDGYVDPSQYSQPLQTLFFSLINSDRRAQAFRLLSEMPEKVASKSTIMSASINLHFRRGDYPAAESTINKLLESQPNNLRIHLNRIDIWLRYRSEKSIENFLNTKVEELEGSPEEFLRLAQLLDRHGHHERALALGYRTHLENRRNPKVQLAYVGLLLRPTSSDKIDLEKTEVGLNTAFTIRNNANEKETFIIEADEALRLIDETIAPTHPFALIANTLKVGDKFKSPNGEEWTILSIKHKYLHLLHERMERFERQFPENGGLQRFTIKEEGEGSLEPILKKIKEKHDRNESIFDKYEDTPLPLEVFAEWLGADVIEAWYGLAQVGRKFKVCHGNTPEREAAVKAINENNKRGCVVDALTLHIIRLFGIEEIIVEICGEIAVTESTKNIFRYRIEQVQAHEEHPFMTMYWRDGHFYRDEITPEQIKQTLSQNQEELDWIDQRIEVLAAESDQIVPEEVGRIRDALSYDFLDPILAAQGSNRLLLCEDQSYRKFGVTNFNLKGTWLQPVLMLALEKEAISKEKYVEVICNLVRAGHTFTSIDSTILQYAMEKGENEFKVAASALFGKDAEIASHQRVMAAFLYEFWKKGIEPNLTEKTATSILLWRLFFGEWTTKVEGITPEKILSLLAPLEGKRFVQYLSGWATGHFLVLAKKNCQPITTKKNKTQKRNKKRKRS